MSRRVVRRPVTILATTRAWLRTSLRVGAAALLAYSCAGKSISTHGDNGSPIDDDGLPGTGATVGAGGGVGKGGIGGKGGTAARGGSVGKGGFAGKGGTTATGGKAGFGGTGIIAGEGGFGGSHDDPPPGGCGGRNEGVVSADCPRVVACISMLNPANARITRNQLVGTVSEGGQAGQGSDPGDEPDDAATTFICDGEVDDAGSGLLAFDYYTPPTGLVNPSVVLATGSQACGGQIFGVVAINTGFELPARRTWTTQCVPVTGAELDDSVTLIIASAGNAPSGVRNVRFVRSCECTREVIRYTTCGDTYTPGECR